VNQFPDRFRHADDLALIHTTGLEVSEYVLPGDLAPTLCDWRRGRDQMGEPVSGTRCKGASQIASSFDETVPG
jgi:hypothetical protein